MRSTVRNVTAEGIEMRGTHSGQPVTINVKQCAQDKEAHVYVDGAYYPHASISSDPSKGGFIVSEADLVKLNGFLKGSMARGVRTRTPGSGANMVSFTPGIRNHLAGEELLEESP